MRVIRSDGCFFVIDSRGVLVIHQANDRGKSFEWRVKVEAGKLLSARDFISQKEIMKNIII